MTTSDSARGDAYRVRLETYNGPLDFLLYLIRRNEIEITDIPIAEVLDQYLAHLEVMKALDLEDVGDFLVMASTLMVIKSRMLLPQERGDTGDDDEDDEDPREDLVRQLLAYKKFRDAADTIDDSRVERWKRFERGSFSEMLFEESLASEEITSGRLLEDVGLWDLFEVFARLMSEVTLVSSTEIIFDEITLEESVAEVEQGLRISGRESLRGLLRGRRDRASVISLFLAILELAKRHVIRLAQVDDYTDIEIRLQEPEPEEEAEVRGMADVETASTEPVSANPVPDASPDVDS